MAKGEIAYDEQFLLLPQCFQLYLIIILKFVENVHILPLRSQNPLLQIYCTWERLKQNEVIHNYKQITCFRRSIYVHF